MCDVMRMFLVALVMSASAAAEPATLDSPLPFSDVKAVVSLPGTTGEVADTLKTITRSGWGPAKDERGPVANGKLEVTPVTESIHIPTLHLATPVELRFLAMTPPPASKPDGLRRRGEKPSNGEPFNIPAMGDPVTATGDYPQMLAQLLARATGNQKITVIKRAYSGKSVDAMVRNFRDDGPPHKPDLGLLMYGVNDQGGGLAPAAGADQVPPLKVAVG
jgi:hypothetical protein